MQEQVYHKDYEINQENKLKFELEQEIEQYTRKGKQPQLNSDDEKKDATTDLSVIP